MLRYIWNKDELIRGASWGVWFRLGTWSAFGVEGHGARRGTLPRILRPGRGKTSDEHAEQGSIRVGGGEVDSTGTDRCPTGTEAG